MKQSYVVKLKKDHLALEHQIVDGYLGMKGNGLKAQKFIYDKKEAYKKARIFGGKAMPYGKIYEHTSTAAILILTRSELHPSILKEMRGREILTDIGRPNESGVAMYERGIFEAILYDCNNEKQTEIELGSLNTLSQDYDYIIVMEKIK